MIRTKFGALIIAFSLIIGMFACGEITSWYVEPAGTVSGNVWDVSYDYDDSYVSGLTITILVWNGTSWEDYYETNDWSDNADWDYDSGCTLTDENGNFTCDFVEEGTYMITIEDPNGNYNTTDYVIEVYFDSTTIDEETGEYQETAEIENSLGVTETVDTTDSVISNDGIYHKIVLTWGDNSDFDGYWSFPRADYNHLMNEKDSPFYPDHETYGPPTTVPNQDLTGTPGYVDGTYLDDSTETTRPTDTNAPEGTMPNGDAPPTELLEKYRAMCDETTITTSETDDTNGFAIDPTAGQFDVDWDFSDDGNPATTDDGDPYLGARGLMYWDYVGNDIHPSPESPHTYTYNYDGDDIVAVGMDRDSYYGPKGPETIFLDGIPGNNWYENSNFPTGVFGEGLEEGAYEIGIGQYTVAFYATPDDYEVGSFAAASRFDSTFASAQVSVSIYDEEGTRLWTFWVPEGNSELGQTLPYRNWRPFYGMYQLEDIDDDGYIEENIVFHPSGFDNIFEYRSNFNGVKATMRTRAR